MSIGDLMVVVVIAALACLAVTATLRSSLDNGDRSAFGLLVLVLFTLQAAQWRLSRVPSGPQDSWKNALLGAFSYVVGMTMFVGVFVLACVFAEGASYVVLTMLVLIVYQTTWD
jgi:hypothetical protein